MPGLGLGLYTEEAFHGRRDLVMFEVVRSAIAAFHHHRDARGYPRARKTLEVLFGTHGPANMVKLVFPLE